MKLKVMFAIVMALGGCSDYKDAEVKDMGKVQVGENVYMKQMRFDYGAGKQDRVYILVDKDDKLIRSPVTMNGKAGKHDVTVSFIAQ